jgi:hypothetical protein
MTTKDDKNSYTILTKKIKKVEAFLKTIQKVDSKEYRAYKRKLDEYTQQLHKNREYKERKLRAALDDLHASLHTNTGASASDDDDIMTANNSTSSMSMSSVDYESTEDEEEEVKKHDFKLLKKKFHKVGRILQELMDEHGEAKASIRKDYKKYLTKQQEYLEQLEETDEWKQEEANRQAREVFEVEQRKIEGEHEAAVAAVRKGQQANLEKAKAEALTKLRAGRAAQEEKEKILEKAYEVAQKAAYGAAMKKAQDIEEETAKRGAEFMDSLKDQEDRGLIVINSRSPH